MLQQGLQEADSEVRKDRNIMKGKATTNNKVGRKLIALTMLEDANEEMTLSRAA